MKITGFLPISMQDWDKGLSSVVFTAGCNYLCPSCHAKKINQSNEDYTEEEILKWLERKSNAVENVVICGGEPTVQLGLEYFLEELKKRGLNVKLDTNGKNYVVLGRLLERKLVDYVAMDIKGPLGLYSRLTGMNVAQCCRLKGFDERDDLLKGMCLVPRFPGYEFRHTCVPLLEGENRFRWMTEEEIDDMGRYVVRNTENNQHKFFIQRFVSRDSEEMMDKRFSKGNLPEEFHETPSRVIDMAYKTLKRHLPETRLR